MDHRSVRTNAVRGESEQLKEAEMELGGEVPQEEIYRVQKEK